MCLVRHRCWIYHSGCRVDRRSWRLNAVCAAAVCAFATETGGTALAEWPQAGEFHLVARIFNGRNIAPSMWLLLVLRSSTAWIEPDQTYHAEALQAEVLRATPVVDISTVTGAGALAGLLHHDPAVCLDTKEVIQRYGGFCAAHVEDSWTTCSKLQACVAIQCLPEDTFYPAQSETASALRAAAVRGDSRNTERLLRIDETAVDAADPLRQRTPLMLASMSGSFETVVTLLRFGASATERDSQGLTARDLATTANPQLTGRVPAALKPSNRESSRAAIVARLEAAERRQQLAAYRLDDRLLRDGEEKRVLVRSAIASDLIAKDKALRQAAQLQDGVRGPICLFASTYEEATDQSLCDANATFLHETTAEVYGKPRRRCQRHLFSPGSLGDVVDLNTMPPSAARLITNARRERRNVLVYNRPQQHTPWATKLVDIALEKAMLNSSIPRAIAVVDGFAAPLLLQ